MAARCLLSFVPVALRISPPLVELGWLGAFGLLIDSIWRLIDPRYLLLIADTYPWS